MFNHISRPALCPSLHQANGLPRERESAAKTIPNALLRHAIREATCNACGGGGGDGLLKPSTRAPVQANKRHPIVAQAAVAAARKQHPHTQGLAVAAASDMSASTAAAVAAALRKLQAAEQQQAQAHQMAVERPPWLPVLSASTLRLTTTFSLSLLHLLVLSYPHSPSQLH